MAKKRALVVDDSKSARVILSRMLEKYDLEVDMAESAEQAIDYLRDNRPDAIFMDHLMPGMDGLQAVQVIKGNPQTAMIPIMMYTSQEGELYVGQARALGALGVLPKQVRPVDVSKVLYELHLLPDRRDFAEPGLVPVATNATAAADAPLQPTPVIAAAAQVPPPDGGRRLEIVVKEQIADMRRFVVASLDSFATRIVSDMRSNAPSAPSEPFPLPRLPAPPARPPLLWIAALIATCAATVVFAVLWATARAQLIRSRVDVTELTAANRDLQSTQQGLQQTIRDLAASLAAGVGPAPLAPIAGSLPPPRSEPVPYGEIPFDRGRLEAVRDFLNKLAAQNFHGTVKITSVAGLYCLSGNAADGYAPANAALPAAKCDLIGNPIEESVNGQQRQSLAFANLVAGVRQRTSGAITVSIDSAGTTRPLVQYPQRTESLTAGEWNRAAAANNRVEIIAEPAPTP